MESKKSIRLGGRVWFNIILFGFIGQIAWAVENMFFNTFLYNAIYNGASQTAVNGSIDVMSAISIMVAASASFTVVATFLMGTLSDKIGKRKPFISIGYIFWGIVTASFGVISREHTAKLFHLTDEIKILTITVASVIIMDCIMSFIGSTGNDAAFNAWVTDITNTHNRATVESVLTLLPIVATAAVMGLTGVIASLGYSIIFIILGAIVSVCGIYGLFSIKDGIVQKAEKGESYWKNLVDSFRPAVVNKNKELYLALTANCLCATAFQVFFPYIFIYLGNVMNFSLDTVFASLTPAIMVIAAAVLIIAVVLIISAGKMMDKLGKQKFMVLSVALYFLGLVAAGFAKDIVIFFICAVPALVGWALFAIAMNASVRDYMPEGKVGAFQGIRIVFTVLIPMIIGPFIGNIICRVSKITYTNEYGVVTSAPGNVMFWAAAAVAVLTLIPVVALRKKSKAAQGE